jgi:hypothetical protein
MKHFLLLTKNKNFEKSVKLGKKTTSIDRNQSIMVSLNDPKLSSSLYFTIFFKIKTIFILQYLF